MRNRFGAILIASSILIVGCDDIDLSDAFYENEEYEKSVKVGYRTEDGINENNIFNIGETVTAVIDNGNESYGVSSMHIYLYKLEGDREITLGYIEEHKDPKHAWSRFNIVEELLYEKGDYKLRIYLGDDYFGEVDFEIVE